LHNPIFFAILSELDIVFFGVMLFLVIIGLGFYFFYSFIVFHRRGDVSPFSGMPLRPGKELTYAMQDKVNRYLKSLHDFDNRPIDFSKSSFCPETGRIFPNSITWSGAIKLDWSFIKNRYRGHFVSWGSLTPEKKKEIESSHHNLFEFQREISSANPSPRMLEEAIAFAKPGPLYVDPETKIVMGWKLVPDTDLEVLIVQKPISVKLLNIQHKP
jgi:hypothetical protein